jgi:hypothetical protein
MPTYFFTHKRSRAVALNNFYYNPFHLIMLAVFVALTVVNLRYWFYVFIQELTHMLVTVAKQNV